MGMLSEVRLWGDLVDQISGRPVMSRRYGDRLYQSEAAQH